VFFMCLVQITFCTIFLFVALFVPTILSRSCVFGILLVFYWYLFLESKEAKSVTDGTHSFAHNQWI
jgi:hypothetical protein